MMTKNTREPATAPAENQEDALAALRAETALSRFPMHCLAKGKTVQIDLANQASAVRWKVDPNPAYGQPGALAYKIDTLIVNRRIQESGRPVPKIIRLGSLHEVAEEAGLGRNTNPAKQALLQNATASITAKLSYRTHEGGEQWLEATFSRYSVIFSGQTLPQGRAADGVCLVLNDIYQQILNTAVFRPLDYEYMKGLSPISQRFYEIASYQVYAALRHGNPRARLSYSDYCLLSTATRYPDFDHVKKQMYKVLRPHVQSGYIAKTEYEPAFDGNGGPDWILCLTPGPKADREFQAFTGHARPRKAPNRPEKVPPPPPRARHPAKTAAEAGAPEDAPEEDAPGSEARDLADQMVQADLNRVDAERFARERPEACRRQLEFLPHVKSFRTSRGAYLRRAIEGDFAPPAAYLKAQEKQREAQAAARRQEQSAARASGEQARQEHQERHDGAYLEYLGRRAVEVERAHPEAFAAFLRQEEEQRQRLLQSPLAGRPMFQATIQNFEQERTRLERFCLYFRERGVEALDFWAWDARLNPRPFQP